VQLKATLAALEADLEDLEQSVKCVFNFLSFLSRKLIICAITMIFIDYAYITLVVSVSAHRIVESTDSRLFGLTEADVQSRRRYVGRVKGEIEVSCQPLPIIRLSN
jgi:Syntaxin 6, N-terminal